TRATIRRSSLIASRRSRPATSAALRRSSFGQLTWVFASLVSDNREVDVLERRQLTHFLTGLQSGVAPKLDDVADRQGPSAGHDADVAGKLFRLLHAVRADDERAAVLLQVFEVVPGAPRAVRVQG